jgi:hypothetical protein
VQASEIFAISCPHISRDTASDLANLARAAAAIRRRADSCPHGEELEDSMAGFVVEAASRPEGADWLKFDEKTMWRGKDVRAGDDVFIFPAEHNGGRGLYARGVVTEAVRGVGSRVSLTVKRTGAAPRPLGRCELRPFRDLSDVGPETEIDRKLYRQATNKIAGVSHAAAAFLQGFF